MQALRQPSHLIRWGLRFSRGLLRWRCPALYRSSPLPWGDCWGIMGGTAGLTGAVDPVSRAFLSRARPKVSCTSTVEPESWPSWSMPRTAPQVTGPCAHTVLPGSPDEQMSR